METNRLASRFRPIVRRQSQVATMHLVQSTRFARRVANLLLLALFLSVLAMAFLPWQQTSNGVGQVVAFVPQERQQTIQAPVKGVVSRIAEGLVEGSQVKRGDLILEIEPVAANMAEQLRGQLVDLQAKLDTENFKAKLYGEQATGFTEARDYAVDAAQQLVESAEAKLQSKQRLIDAYAAKELQAQQNYERQRKLWIDGIKPGKEIEKLKKDLDVTQAELKSIHQDVESLKKELAAKKNELEEKRRLAQTKVDSAMATQQDALGKAAEIRKQVREIEIKLSEMGRLTITAPRDGTIFRMPVFERGQALKAGESILTLIPDASQKAVELMIRGNDMPLIKVGQEVRLQFEGWPAVQFAGWPSVAVGTFSGVVSTVDATDNGLGQFRILVTPNLEAGQSWPSDRFLRQGVRANGWVMLKRVRLGYEIWRQLNGFPVIIADKEPKSSTPKLPKVPQAK